ncbi:MAG TPA: carbohydrate kinase family protein [Stellaceae bacterium]|nr:carbohydrate kinase family protein [Stellaceae bacterium]
MKSGQRRGFLTGGTWCADHNKLLEFWPAEGTAAQIIEDSVEGGGSACNFAIDIRRLDPGMPVETIGCLGDDVDGRLLVAQADAHGLGRDGLLIVKNGRTNYTDAYSVRSTARRTHLFHQGTSALLSPDHFDFSRTTARIFHLGLPGIHAIMDGLWKGEANGWLAVLKDAKAHGLETNFELVQIQPERLRGFIEPCLGHLDYLVINDYEVGAITGRQTVHDDVTDLQACLEAGADLMDRGSMRILAIHFPLGAFAFERGRGVLRWPAVAVPADAVKGANGAGDAFAAGFLYAIHELHPVVEALRLAHAAAAASLRSVGTTGGVERWQRCLELAERWGWQSMPA